jgi:hypothetical protein
MFLLSKLSKLAPERIQISFQWVLRTHSTEVNLPRREADHSQSLCINPLTPNDLKRRRAVSPLKIKIPSKNMREKPTDTPIIHSGYLLCMVAPTCFGITLPFSGSVPSAF